MRAEILCVFAQRTAGSSGEHHERDRTVARQPFKNTVSWARFQLVCQVL